MLLFALSGFAAQRDSQSPDQRYKFLLKVVDKNTGYAHFTRGMNERTISALPHAATTSDIPILKRMLEDPDHVAAMTAVNVLMNMGYQGQLSVYGIFQNTKEPSVRNVLAGQLMMPDQTKAALWKEDIPKLKEMALSDSIEVVAVAVDFLKAMGSEKKLALKEVYSSTNNQTTKDWISKWEAS